MNDHQAAAVERRACASKRKYGAERARRVAERLRSEGHDVHAYRCCFCHSWHVGHTPSWASVKRLAKAIRHRAYPEGPHVERAG